MATTSRKRSDDPAALCGEKGMVWQAGQAPALWHQCSPVMPTDRRGMRLPAKAQGRVRASQRAAPGPGEGSPCAALFVDWAPRGPLAPGVVALPVRACPSAGGLAPGSTAQNRLAPSTTVQWEITRSLVPTRPGHWAQRPFLCLLWECSLHPGVCAVDLTEGETEQDGVGAF